MAGGNDYKEHNGTYKKVFMPLVKYGTPIFLVLMLVVVFFTT
jgi:hypothetical protein